MRSTPMPAIACRFVLLAIIVFLATAASGDVYQIVNYPNLQDGVSLSGTIHASDVNHDTALDSAELAAWSLTIAGHTSTSTDPLAGSLLANVSIANGQI